METVQAALVHDIGKLTVMDIIESEKPSLDEKMRLEIAEVGGFDMIDIAFSSAPNVKRICVQARKALASLNTGEDINAMRMGNGARVLAVAETYDRMTAVQFEKEPTSEVAVLKYFLDNPRVFDSRVVNALIKSINILVPGVSVELNTGEKALVLSANEQNVLQPTILMFGDNSIVDLADREMYEDLEIKDIMKTMDNRHVMDINLLKQSGIKVEEPEYVEIPII